jgi:hypothetical protein
MAVRWSCSSSITICAICQLPALGNSLGNSWCGQKHVKSVPTNSDQKAAHPQSATELTCAPLLALSDASSSRKRNVRKSMNAFRQRGDDNASPRNRMIGMLELATASRRV